MVDYWLVSIDSIDKGFYYWYIVTALFIMTVSQHDLIG
jgi:hypothetical protein